MHKFHGHKILLDKFSWGWIFMNDGVGGWKIKYNEFKPYNHNFWIITQDRMALVKYQKVSVCGYHVCKHIWNSTMSGKLVCMTDLSNFYDSYAIAVEKHGIIVGHLPRKVSCVTCHSRPLESGRPLNGRRYFPSAIFKVQACGHAPYMLWCMWQIFCANFHCGSKFCGLIVLARKN